MIRFSRKSSNKIRRLTCRGDCGSNSSENHRAGARRSDAGPTREHRGVSRVHQGTLVPESEDAAALEKGVTSFEQAIDADPSESSIRCRWPPTPTWDSSTTTAAT